LFFNVRGFMNSNFNLNPLIKENTEIKAPKDELDEFYEKSIDSQLDDLLEDDTYYQMQSTPLKPPAAVKADHRRQIKEQLEAKELRDHIRRAHELIMTQLPTMISPAEFDKLKDEFAKSVSHFIEMSKKSEEELNQYMSLQEICGISDESIEHIYALAYSLLKSKEFKDAESVLTFLVLLDPDISFFWSALGVSLQGQAKYEDSAVILEIAQVLNPEDPNAFILGAQSQIHLKQKEEARKQLDAAAKILVDSTEIENKNELLDQVNSLKNQL
jgi:tetratricopeptide (TPR) repeat protein